MFSSTFLSVLVYGSLIWCTLSAFALISMLLRDLLQGRIW